MNQAMNLSIEYTVDAAQTTNEFLNQYCTV